MNNSKRKVDPVKLAEVVGADIEEIEDLITLKILKTNKDGIVLQDGIKVYCDQLRQSRKGIKNIAALNREILEVKLDKEKLLLKKEQQRMAKIQKAMK